MKASRPRIHLVRLSARQVAGRLRISVRRARHLMVKGPLDSIRAGRFLFAELGAVERYQKRVA